MSINEPILDLVFSLNGVVSFSDEITNERVALDKGSWVLFNHNIKRIIYEQAYNTDEHIIHIVINKIILEELLEYDTPFSGFLKEIIEDREKRTIPYSGKVNIKIYSLLREIISLKDETSIQSLLLLELKIKEIIFQVLKTVFFQDSEPIYKRVDSIISTQYRDITVKELSNIF